jgi:hypothetical protein
MDLSNQIGGEEGMVPNIQGEPEQQASGLSEEQMRANLNELMGNIESKHQELEGEQFISKAKIQEKRSESLRKIFDLFSSWGVDLNNVEEVQKFFDELKQKNPEMAKQLEEALLIILGEDGLQQEGGSGGEMLPEEGEGLMPQMPQMPPTNEEQGIMGGQGPVPGNMNINNEVPPEEI